MAFSCILESRRNRKSNARNKWAIHDIIYDYLDNDMPWVSPVGRLDRDTSGLLLLTNDTEFANSVTHPASRVCKTYVVKVSALMHDDIIPLWPPG